MYNVYMDSDFLNNLVYGVNEIKFIESVYDFINIQRLRINTLKFSKAVSNRLIALLSWNDYNSTPFSVIIQKNIHSNTWYLEINGLYPITYETDELKSIDEVKSSFIKHIDVIAEYHKKNIYNIIGIVKDEML